jgi:hypothetical protein
MAMKSLFVLFVVSLLFAGNLPADQGTMIKQKAKNIANQNNAQQGVPTAPPSSPKPASSPSPAPPAPPPPQQLTPQQQAFVQLVKDLEAIKPESLAERKEQLAADLLAVAQGANKPSWAALRKLAEDLATALAGKTIAPAQRSRLAQDLQAVLNGANYPPSQLDDIITDVPAILKKAGADAKAAAAVGEDLKAITAELAKK